MCTLFIPWNDSLETTAVVATAKGIFIPPCHHKWRNELPSGHVGGGYVAWFLPSCVMCWAAIGTEWEGRVLACGVTSALVSLFLSCLGKGPFLGPTKGKSDLDGLGTWRRASSAHRYMPAAWYGSWWGVCCIEYDYFGHFELWKGRIRIFLNDDIL